MNRRTVWGSLLTTLSVVLAILSGCSEVADPLKRPTGADSGACLSCHADEARLEATAEPDTLEEEPPGQG